MLVPVPPDAWLCRMGRSLRRHLAGPEIVWCCLLQEVKSSVAVCRGVEDDAEQGLRLIEQHAVTSQDVLIAVAASGTTRFTLACLREAKLRGALTLGIANNQASPILQDADHPIFLDTGSSRLLGLPDLRLARHRRWL